MSLAVGLWALFWVLDAAADSLLFGQGSFQEMLLYPAGSELWMRLGLFAILLVFAAVAGRLIDEKKSVETTLRSVEAQYARIIRTTGEGVWMIDREGRTTYANSRMADILGVTMGQMLVSTMWDFMDDEAKARAGNNMDRRRQGISEEHSFKFRRLDGTEVWVEMQTDPLFDADGNFEGALGMTRDVTARKMAEIELRESESKWRSVAESSPDYVLSLDLDGKILFCNRTIPELTMDQVLGVNVFDLTAPEFHAAQRGCMDHVIATGKPGSYCGEYHHHDGTARSFETRIWPVIREGRVVSLTSSATDVTEQRKEEKRRSELERQLAHARRMESLGMLAGGIAHDFNNLLTPILGHATLAERSLEPGSETLENIVSIKAAARRAADLVKQLLHSTGKGRRSQSPVSLNAAAEELSKVMRVSIPAAVDLRLELSPDVTPVQGDPGQINQILVNLIQNAVEAIGDNPGTITISSAAAEVTDREPVVSVNGKALAAGRYVRLDIRDNGCGMDESVLAHIFDPFFSTKPRGRGLGLSALLGIVQSHRGAIQVESQPGRGTLMRLYFPVASVKPEPKPAPAVQPRAAAGRILVVDDEKDIRDTIVAMTETLGFSVEGLTGGGDVLGLLSRDGKDVSCVLLDLNMPEMDGWQVLSRLKSQRPQLPVILMSGYADPDALETVLSRGASGFLQKPLSMETLRDQINSVISG